MFSKNKLSREDVVAFKATMDKQISNNMGARAKDIGGKLSAEIVKIIDRVSVKFNKIKDAGICYDKGNFLSVSHTTRGNVDLSHIFPSMTLERDEKTKEWYVSSTLKFEALYTYETFGNIGEISDMVTIDGVNSVDIVNQIVDNHITKLESRAVFGKIKWFVRDKELKVYIYL